MPLIRSLGSWGGGGGLVLVGGGGVAVGRGVWVGGAVGGGTVLVGSGVAVGTNATATVVASGWLPEGPPVPGVPVASTAVPVTGSLVMSMKISTKRVITQPGRLSAV